MDYSVHDVHSDDNSHLLYAMNTMNCARQGTARESRILVNRANIHQNQPQMSPEQKKESFYSNYISSMLTKTSSGTRILIIRLITRSSESMSMRRLWIRISHLSQVAVPSPHGVLRTGTRSRLVGREIGPVILTPVLSAMVFSSLHTSSSLW